jgi:peroxiredoxin
MNDLDTLPSDLPVPIDDGACAHLAGRMLPAISLPTTDGDSLDLAQLPGLCVIYLYPRTGQPGVPPLVDNWNDIPGARGCTPQSKGFRDLASELKALGASIFGLSTQTVDYQKELVTRLELPFPLLSDAELKLAKALRIPTFEAAHQILFKRMAWVINAGKIVKVFYPVFPPDQNAREVLAWLKSRPC